MSKRIRPNTLAARRLVRDFWHSPTMGRVTFADNVRRVDHMDLYDASKRRIGTVTLDVWENEKP